MPDAQPSSEIRAQRGAWLNPISDEHCDYFRDGILVTERMNNSWTIVELGPAEEMIKKHGLDESVIEREDR